MTATPVYWEPWTPAVGDRVRVRLSAECPVTWTHDAPELDGVTGWVRETGPLHHFAGHEYYVEFDRRVPCRRGPKRLADVYYGCVFAAIELEPILTDGES